jgi:hypothetical protein
MGWPVTYHSAISEVYQYMSDRRKDEVKGRFRPRLFTAPRLRPDFTMTI